METHEAEIVTRNLFKEWLCDVRDICVNHIQDGTDPLLFVNALKRKSPSYKHFIDLALKESIRLTGNE